MEQRQKAISKFISLFCLGSLMALMPRAEAQEVLWASKVIKYTSQQGEKRYSAQQVLGKPNATADSTWQGWQPYGVAREESIVVGFDKPLHAKQILIVEGMNTGFVRKVCAISTDGMEYEVAHFPAKPGTKHAKLTQVNVADYNIHIAAVKVVLIPVRNVSTTIDAIGITTSTQQYQLGKMQDVIALDGN